MKTENKNLEFFATLYDARKRFNEISQPCDLLESLNGFYVEIRTGKQKTLNEIGHKNYKLLSQK